MAAVEVTVSVSLDGRIAFDIFSRYPEVFFDNVLCSISDVPKVSLDPSALVALFASFRTSCSCSATVLDHLSFFRHSRPKQNKKI